MRRRLVLLMGTFAVLLLGYLGYHYAVRQDAPADRGEAPPKTDKNKEDVPWPGPDDVSVTPGTSLRITQYHPKYHRLEAVYLAETWDKVGDRFLLTKPKMEWYLRGGEVITIQAKRGTMRARDIGGRWSVLDGDLAGEVWIVLDASRQPGRRPLAERPADAVRINVDEIRFDREALLIESESHVNVFAHQADLLGRGLRISWSMGPRQLRELRIVHGEYMCIRQGQERFVGDLSLPGSAERGSATTAPVGGTESSAAPALELPAGSGLLAARLVPAALAVAQTTRAAATGPAASAPSTAPAESGPATATSTAPAPPLPVVPDTYVAFLTGDVAVTSGQRYLKDADRLELVFEFKPPRRERTTTTATAPTATTATAPGPTPRRGAGLRLPGRGETDTAGEPLVITWDGPLVVTPLRGLEKPIPGRLDVRAEGRRLRLSDGKSSARCQVFEFCSTDRRGRLVGSDAEPVEFHMAGGEIARVRQIRFDRRRGQVNLDGAGEMHFPGGAAQAAADRRELHIRWNRDVEILVGRREIKRAGRREDQDFLLEATFNDKVDVTQAPSQEMQTERLKVTFHRPVLETDPANRPAELLAAGGVHLTEAESGDFIKSQMLDVTMSGLHEASSYPKVAVARGKVSARQEQTEITTDELTVTFASERDEKTNKPRVRPKRLEARGAVHVVDRRDEDVVTAQGETLTSNLTERSAVLVGKPARVTQKDKEMEGERILFNQARETATVVGRGRLRFDTRTDLSGRKLDKARPVRMSFTKKLDYRGKERIALVEGGVLLQTPGDSVRCENIRILFAAPKKQPAPATRASELVGFRPKDIAMVLADKNVRLASVRQDAEGYLTRRLTLRSDAGQVVYESALEKLTCIGAGTMVVEDYRKPEEKPGPAQSPLPGADVARPSQSVFTWSRSMDLSQKDRIANLAGKVAMVHRSGNEVVLTKRLKVRPWGELPSGRNMKMHCDRMFAEFAPPEPGEGARGGDALTGPRVGPLELFRARAAGREYVRIFNPPIEVFCRRVLYQRARDIAIVYGHLENEPPRNALIYRKDPTRRRLDVMEESSKIIWRPSTNRVEARGVKVTGTM